MTKGQLYNKIQFHSHDTWVNSPEYKELMRRLKTMSIEELEADGYDIPVWKRQGAAQQPAGATN